jgi:TPR repeat protein
MHMQLIGSLLCLSLVMAWPVWAGFDEGITADERADFAIAFIEFLLLALEGNAEAQFNVGLMYAQGGHGVPQDYALAAQWFRKAAEQGHAYAQNNLGVMYRTGKGVPQDYALAAQWFRKAAEQDNAGAQYNLGLMYAKGHSVPQDYALAAQWYRKAAEQGHADAQYNLGDMYRTGEGVPQDYALAVRWYRKAAEQGYTDAQNNLGAMYDNGEGVPQDYLQAYIWYNLAAARSPTGANHDRAVRNRDRIAARLTPAQLADAQTRARTWHPKPETPVSVPIAAPSPSAPSSSHSYLIRQVQERLQATGFKPGTIDGVLGRQTRDALRRFQNTKGLLATGELDEKTLDALGIQ